MNKYFKFMSVAAVALLAAACSSDEPNGGPDTTGKDGQAFMKVRINYADGAPQPAPSRTAETSSTQYRPPASSSMTTSRTM